MAVKINPTRMELKRVRERLKTAVRGHKLLKDKSEEMIRQFTILIRKNKKLREEIESELSAALKSLCSQAFLQTARRLSRRYRCLP